VRKFLILKRTNRARLLPLLFLLFRNNKVVIFGDLLLANCTAACSMIGYWHDTVVCLSVHLYWKNFAIKLKLERVLVVTVLVIHVFYVCKSFI